MKIGIDARMFGPEQAGLGRYIEQLILHLEHIDKSNQYILFLKKDNFEKYIPKNPNFEKVLADISWYSWAEQFKFKRIIKKQKLDLMHFPHWNVPIFYRDPFVVTIHDLIMYHYPRHEASTLGPISYWFKDRASRVVLNHAIKKSRKIFVTSEFTKHDLNKTLGVNLNKMVTLYQAPFFKEQRKRTKEDQKEFFEKLKIEKPYLLYVGNAYPHKNLERLVQAWNLFTRQHGLHFQLVLAGKRNFFYDRLFESETVKSSNGIIFTDFLADDDLQLLYDHAQAFIFPSLYEGFGLPPIEAMYHGLPVASSNQTSLPEVLGRSAIYFDPTNIEYMATSIYKILTDQNLRLNLQQNSKYELRRFSWGSLSSRAVKVYQSIV